MAEFYASIETLKERSSQRARGASEKSVLYVVVCSMMYIMYADVTHNSVEAQRLAQQGLTLESAIPTSRILIFDGEIETRNLLVDFLAMSGHSVLSSGSADEALSLIQAHSIKLAVVDADRPGGFELISRLQVDYPDVYLLAMSASDDVDQVVKIMRSGASDYVAKPFKIGSVVKQVDRGLIQQASETENIELRSALALYGLADRLKESSDLLVSLKLVASTALAQLKADGVSIILTDRTDDLQQLGVGRISDVSYADLTELSRRETSGFVAGGNRVFRYLAESDRTMTITAVAVVPLMARGAPLGWIVASRTQGRGFTEGDRKLLTILGDRAAVCARNGALSETLETSFRSTIGALIAALEEKDEYTAGHSERVARLSGLIARSLGLSEREIEVVTQAGRLHDIGKLAIRTEELNKPGPLTDEEYERMKMHTITGRDLLAPIPFFEEILPAVSGHHEKLDGTGYPFGAKGQEIPLIARIVAVADAFDAMTTDRAYRLAMSTSDAIDELRRCSGTHFDQDVVHAFERALAQGPQPA